MKWCIMLIVEFEIDICSHKTTDCKNVHYYEVVQQNDKGGYIK